MWVRIGPGQYKNKTTGKVISGQATDPNKNPKYNKPSGGTPTAPASPTPAAPVPAPNPALSESLQGLAAAGTAPVERTITPENFAPQRAAFEKQQYEALTAGYGERQAQQKQQLEQDLYNRGYRPDQTTTQGAGSWNDMQGSFNKSWNDAYLQAGAKAGEMGGQEFDRMFGAQEAARGLDVERELGMGQLADSALSRRQRMEELRRQLAGNAAIARIQKGPSGGYRPRGPAQADPGFDILGGNL